jgi:hypothetical protein
MKMSDDEIKQVFFHCDNNNPESLYCDVDIIEFGRKLSAYATALEHSRCLAIVKSYSDDAAEALKDGAPTFEWRTK